MPIYEYNCADCGTEFEELVYGNAEPDCPKCGSSKTTRLVSCACVRTSSADEHTSSTHGGGGCGGCSGGNCASCH